MKFAAFDLEIFKSIPDDSINWREHAPLGVSCACYMTSDGHERLDFGYQGLSTNRLKSFVNRLERLQRLGYQLVSVNGLGFDFAVLADETGETQQCARLALEHADMMMMCLCRYGWPIGVKALASGANVKSKLEQVVLNSGDVLEHMSGALAPKLWRDGEHNAVIEYLKQDVKTTLDIAQVAAKRGELAWRSRSGEPYNIPLVDNKLPTVRECLKWPEPDTSWMTRKMTRMQFAAWALKESLQ